MKKALLACTVLGTIAGSACAQTSVTIYGIVDVGIAREDNGAAAGSVTRMDSGILNGSRLGFRGSEDLGGGLSAIFNVENGYNADTGSAAQGGLLFGRQAWVGLRGDFGTVRLGRLSTVMFDNSGAFDPFGDTLAGDTSRLFNYAGFRTNNTIGYGHSRNGFSGQLQYGLGEVAGDNSAGRTIAFSAGYKVNPVDIVVLQSRNTSASGATTGKTTLIGGNYNFGMVKLYATYAWNKDVTPTGVVTAGADTTNALIGLTAPLGASGTLIASFIKLDDKAASAADAKQIALGYTHSLSKRTALYTSYARLSNDSSARYLVPAPGLTDKLLNVGIRHWF
jgi:predicted porin